jgi:hypothetical protein
MLVLVRDEKILDRSSKRLWTVDPKAELYGDYLRCLLDSMQSVMQKSTLKTLEKIRYRIISIKN